MALNLNMLVNNHTQLINFLIEKYNLESYCEIGLQNAANNFNKIQCNLKCSVDPDPKARAMFDCTSDEFFEVNTTNFSIFFIDGYHESSQVERDFNNSLKCLNDGGFIVVHDVLPEKEETTHVPRDSKVWYGNVYQWAMNLKYYTGIKYFTLNMDCGCMVIWKTGEVFKAPAKNFTWEFYLDQRKSFMNIIEPSELDKYLPKVKNELVESK